MMTTELLQSTIGTVKREIEEIFFRIHNRYANNVLKDIKSIYDALEFGRVVSEEDKAKLEPILAIYASFIGLQETYDHETEEVLDQYREIKRKLLEAEKNLL